MTQIYCRIMRKETRTCLKYSLNTYIVKSMNLSEITMFEVNFSLKINVYEIELFVVVQKLLYILHFI